MKIKLKGLICAALFLSVACLFAQNKSSSQTAASDSLSRGESLFKENNAKDAVQVLEYEIMNGQISDNSYNFLGLGYYQLGEFDKSLEAFRRGLKAQPDNAKILSYNLGNTYYAIKDYAAAAGCYSDALKADPLFYDAILNRANALLMSGQLLSAKEEYIDFLAKCPDNPQHERIEMLIKALEEEIARREEEERLLAEQNKAQWEEYDGKLSEKKNESFSPDWEKVDRDLAEGTKNPDSAEWERISGEEPEQLQDNSDSSPLAENDSSWEELEHDKYDAVAEAKQTDEKVNDNWEAFDYENASAIKSEEIEAEEPEWLAFNADELEEMEELEKESREEHEKWLADQRRRAQEIASREASARQKKQQEALEEERRLREQMLEDMRKSEEDRRKKLLEDVANSLQGSDSTNLTSGAEDLIEYDLEGELD